MTVLQSIQYEICMIEQYAKNPAGAAIDAKNYCDCKVYGTNCVWSWLGGLLGL